MKWRPRKSFKIFTPTVSLRRRVAYSLAIVRMVLVPVIFLAVYYLFAMGRIIDRIVNVDAPAAAAAEQASSDMLEARRAERNYFLLHDSASLQANRDALGRVRESFSTIGTLESEELPAVQQAVKAVDSYQQQFASAVSTMSQPGQTPVERIQSVVQAYKTDLDNLMKASPRHTREKFIDELRARVNSFDSQITDTVQSGNPALRQVTGGLQASSEETLQLAEGLRKRNWQHVQADHHEARRLIHRAEWTFTIVSFFTLLLSVWISFILPREVVEPLVRLREAVDHAAAGNYDIEFETRGGGELVDLARSLQNLAAHLRGIA
ncbi:MAG TPA: HAMP domain-containing protein [Candidatus Acidoferrum sp.]